MSLPKIRNISKKTKAAGILMISHMFIIIAKMLPNYRTEDFVAKSLPKKYTTYAEQAILKNSSLRFDWTDVPPMSPLGKIIEESQSQCMNATAVELKGGPQEMVFSNIGAWPHGMGSALHTWMHPLCLASTENKILVSGGSEWIWNDQMTCPQEFKMAKVAKSTSAWQNQGDDSHSALWCYFGWHESGLRCPPGTIAWDKPPIDFGDDFLSYKCDSYLEKYGKQTIRNAAIEWLFQNVSLLVIREAERQIREEAFPADENTTAITNTREFLRWPLIPSADSLITVHIRLGDKSSEMELLSISDYINGTKSLLTENEISGREDVHIFVVTENPSAVKLFSDASPTNWIVHSSGPKHPEDNNFVPALASSSRGRAGLESLASLLVSLESNRYVLCLGSNWSRLINELRATVVDYRCRNCTKMLNLRDLYDHLENAWGIA